MIPLVDFKNTIFECGEEIEVTRFLSAPVLKGRLQGTPIESKFVVRMSVQPMNQSELQRLPEGLRTQGSVKCYTSTELKTVVTSDCDIPDRFDYQGVTYQVQSIENWSNVANYFKIIAVRMGQ